MTPCPVCGAATWPSCEIDRRSNRVASPERDYFVSLIRDSRTALLVGPFGTHDEALARVQDARAAASRIDPWSDFDAIGTCSLRAGSGRVGRLNAQLNPPER